METCKVCGNKVDDFDICTHETRFETSFGGRLTAPFMTTNQSAKFEDTDSISKSIAPFVFGPFSALILDLIFPTWSTLWVSLGLVVFASVLTNSIWSHLGTGVPFSFAGFLKSLPHQVFTPKIIRLYSPVNKYKQHVLTWVASFIVATLAVLWIGTPGNGTGLEKSLQSGIKAKTGQTLSVSCPSVFLTTPGSTTTCQVKLILGIKVPVRVKTEDLLGNISWNASIN